MCYYRISNPQKSIIKPTTILNQSPDACEKSNEQKQQQQHIQTTTISSISSISDGINANQDKNAELVLALKNLLNPISYLNNTQKNHNIFTNLSMEFPYNLGQFPSFNQISNGQSLLKLPLQQQPQHIVQASQALQQQPIQQPLQQQVQNLSFIKAIHQNQYDSDKTLNEKLLDLMNENFNLINQIQESTQKHTMALIHTTEQVTNLKKEILETQSHTEKKSEPSKCSIIEQQKQGSMMRDKNYNPSSCELFKHLCGSNDKYLYELVLDTELPTPLFRERNLKIKVSMVDIFTKKPIQTHSKIFLQLTLHTWEIPSNIITRNKTGNKVIQGETEYELKGGQALFDKLQINEVTSKFINGYVCLLVCPKRPNNYGTSLNELEKDNKDYSIEDIKPLMIEKIIVKSKKKKRYTSNIIKIKNCNH